jgi:hypothetical protein
MDGIVQTCSALCCCSIRRKGGWDMNEKGSTGRDAKSRRNKS